MINRSFSVPSLMNKCYLSILPICMSSSSLKCASRMVARKHNIGNVTQFPSAWDEQQQEQQTGVYLASINTAISPNYRKALHAERILFPFQSKFACLDSLREISLLFVQSLNMNKQFSKLTHSSSAIIPFPSRVQWHHQHR